MCSRIDPARICPPSRILGLGSYRRRASVARPLLRNNQRAALAKRSPSVGKGLGGAGKAARPIGKSRYTANTTEQMLKRMAPNTKVNTIMGQTNLNQWDIFMSSICSVAITRPVGAM